ncbi:hypothetical protein H0H93_000718 [Arthromyces matolae]|nr:hypothetical protein H0H93_000718 [Arthromyces matolae]
MPSNLDLAVRDLVLTKNTPTVAAVMAVYIRMSGLDNESVQQSMSSFERALEKHPHRDDEVSTAIAKVRNDYCET